MKISFNELPPVLKFKTENNPPTHIERTPPSRFIMFQHDRITVWDLAGTETLPTNEIKPVSTVKLVSSVAAPGGTLTAYDDGSEYLDSGEGPQKV